MLSQENINKIVMTGLYRHDPDKRYRSPLYWGQMYHCFNWTFRVLRVKHFDKNNTWYMVDTYFNNKSIELTDENFDEFEFLFDFNEVENHSGKNIYEYDANDWWHVAVDSGGMSCGGKYFVRKGATKIKNRVIERLENEIKSLESDIRYKKETLERVKNDEVNLEYV